MLGLKFQDDAAAFDEALSAFIVGLGNAGRSGWLTRRSSPRRLQSCIASLACALGFEIGQGKAPLS